MEIETPVPPAAAIPAPIAAPVAAAPITPMPEQPMALQSGGGEGNFVDILKSLNWIEVGFGILGVTALLWTIHYYKYNLQVAKKTTTDLQNQLDQLTIKIADVQSVQKAMENKKSRNWGGPGYR